MKPFIMYKNHVNGIGTWKIWYEENIIHICHATTEGGAEVFHTETVSEGKQSRSIKEQIITRIQSRVNKQKDKGYVKNREDALKPPTNTLNLTQPMLALPAKRAGVIDVPSAYYQPKLDGHRCIVAKVDGKLIAYTRQGKEIVTIGHILANLRHLPEGMFLDGELYHHGTSLQTIGSWVKRFQDSTLLIKYVIYDCISNKKFKERLNILMDLGLNSNTTSVLETFKLDSNFDFDYKLRQFKNMGYEGIIIRHTTLGYQGGRRSRALVKVKYTSDEPLEEAEFLVTDVVPSKTGWGILCCVTDKGKPFRISAPGTTSNKKEILINKDEYIGEYITAEFSQWTDDQIPFHAVALRFREDI